ncbi:Protein of unknown function [Bacillus cereus]|nr:Protein of unknown function [Bacillus cereus]
MSVSVSDELWSDPIW